MLSPVYTRTELRVSCCGPVGVAASGSPPFGPRKPRSPSRTRPRTDQGRGARHVTYRPLFRVPPTGAGQRNGGKRMVSAVSQGPQVAYDAAAGLGHTGVCGSEPEAFCFDLGLCARRAQRSCRGIGDKPGASLRFIDRWLAPFAFRAWRASIWLGWQNNGGTAFHDRDHRA